MSQVEAPERIGLRRGVAAVAGDGFHVHGVVPAGAAPADRDLELVPYGQVVGLVRQAMARPASRARRELLRHAELLDGLVVTTPVVPLRFGTVLPSPEDVQRDLLAPYHDAFTAALGTLAGRAQFTVRARYLSDAILRELLDREPQLRRVHQRLRARDGQSDRPARMVFGEMVAAALRAGREADAAVLAGALRPHAALTAVQAPSAVEGYRIADGAFLVDLDRRERFESAVEELAGRWRDRARLRLLGPMAPYHFADRLIYGPLGGR
jgi:hypothetical protein